jgi:hypothetical protein
MITIEIKLHTTLKQSDGELLARFLGEKHRLSGVEFKWGVEGVLENLPIWRDMGYLPMYDLELWPRPAQKMALATESEQKERQLELVPA